MQLHSAVSKIGVSFVVITALIAFVRTGVYVSTVQNTTSLSITTVQNSTSPSNSTFTTSTSLSESYLTCGIVTGYITTSGNEEIFNQSIVTCNTTSTSNQSNKSIASSGIIVNQVNVYWLGYVRSFNSSSSENYRLTSGQGFNYTVGYDGYASNYTIESVYTNTSGFSVTGIYWDAYTMPRYNLPQSVYVGSNFPFFISIVASSTHSFKGAVSVYVVTSSSCCYFNGTSSS
jgi:hypothetical protein